MKTISIKIAIKTLISSIFFCLILLVAVGCDDLLKVENPASLVPKDLVFKDDVTATSAITGMYVVMIGNTSNFASGSSNSLATLTGLSSDELLNYNADQIDYEQFEQNNLLSNNSFISTLWKTPYEIIYQANSAIEALNKSAGLSSSVRNQLIGEALFIRAFCHFNLTNMFGDVPIIISTDYRVNTNAPRVTTENVYDQIIEDLLEAQALLSDTYPSTQRVRPNKATATALLSRVYIYREDWSNAEIQASAIIQDGRYTLEPDLNRVFLSTSTDAIWQLRPILNEFNTWEGAYSILYDLPYYYYLRDEFVSSFEDGDARLNNWVGSFSDGVDTFFYPYKYKIAFGGPGSTPSVPLSEYSMVFRVSEQYLIRAEARLHLGDLPNSITDLDKIRERAELPLIADTNPGISESDLLSAIINERRHELFTEGGHRWFDLKRANQAISELGSIKPDLSINDLLYPIPATEFIRNRNLGLQNPGY